MPNPITVENVEKFLMPENLIESDSPEIRKMAKKLSGDNRITTAANIFDCNHRRKNQPKFPVLKPARE
jgi:hypothetical protein